MGGHGAPEIEVVVALVEVEVVCLGGVGCYRLVVEVGGEMNGAACDMVSWVSTNRGIRA